MSRVLLLLPLLLGLVCVHGLNMNDLSEEDQLVDCCRNSFGCKGGFPQGAINELVKQGGIQIEQDYPYSQNDGQCKIDKAKFKAHVSSSVSLSQSEDDQATYLMENGPLSTAINADGLQFYTGGVLDLDSSACNPFGLNHAVLTTGFGIERNVPFWEIRNSWGEDWGIKGYFKIRRGSGVCGINRMVSSAVIT